MVKNNNNDSKSSSSKQATKSTKDSKRASNVRRNKTQQPKKDSRSKRVNYDNTRASKFDKDLEASKYSRKPGMNDISWYAHNPELLKAAASLPFSSITGRPIGFPGLGTDGTQYTVPGVMAFGWEPAFGGGSKPPYALNQCAASMYSFLVHANSRNYTYEQSDLMVLVLAGAQIFSTLANVIRAYGISKTYYEQNAYVPDTLLKMSGFDPVDFRQHLGQIWFDINNFVAQTAQIWIPNTLPLIQRWFWMNSNVYKDDSDPKGQMYMFVPQTVYKYNATQTSTGGGLESVVSGSTIFSPAQYEYTWEIWRNTIQEMIDALLGDEDRGIIYGDLLNAYGKDKIYALPPIPSDYRVEPIYSQEVLTQIENMTVGCSTFRGLMQQNGLLIPVFEERNSKVWSAGWMLPAQNVLNFHQAEQPTPEQIMIATRLMSNTSEWSTTAPSYKITDGVASITNTGKPTTYPMYCGSEHIANFSFTLAANNGSIQKGQQLIVNGDWNSSMGSGGYYQIYKALFAFDWHPFQYFLSSPTSTETQGSDTIWALGDYANYAVLWGPNVGKLHDTALFSLFGIPQI